MMADPAASVRSPHPGLRLRGGSRGRRAGDSRFRALAGLCAASVVMALGLMLVATGRMALPFVHDVGVGQFVAGQRWAPAAGVYQALPFIAGTLLTSVIALVLAVPVAIGVALFTTELAPRRVRAVLGGLVDLLAAIPSVVYGLWAVLVLVPQLDRFAWHPIAAQLGESVPWLAGPSTGRSFATAGVVLAIMALPIMCAVTREVIATVPREHREAALALAATRWEVVRLAVLPHARAGIVGAVMLGFGRAVGETIAVALVIGGSVGLPHSIFAPGSTMASVIANEFPEAGGAHVQALIALGLLLFAITLVINIGARLFVARAHNYGRRGV